MKIGNIKYNAGLNFKRVIPVQYVELNGQSANIKDQKEVGEQFAKMLRKAEKNRETHNSLRLTFEEAVDDYKAPVKKSDHPVIKLIDSKFKSFFILTGKEAKEVEEVGAMLGRTRANAAQAHLEKEKYEWTQKAKVLQNDYNKLIDRILSDIDRYGGDLHIEAVTKPNKKVSSGYDIIIKNFNVFA
jgi:hypothetical protein